MLDLTAFSKYLYLLIQAKGRTNDAIARARHEGAPDVVIKALQEKAAVSAATLTDSQWAGPLTQFQTLIGDWFATLRNVSLLDALIAEGAKRIPQNVRFALTTLGASGAIIDAAAWFELSKLEFEGAVGGFKWSMAALVLSNDLQKFTNASARALINQELSAAVASTANRSVIGTLLDSISPSSSSGHARTDLQTLFAAVPLGSISKPVLAASPNVIKALALLGGDGPAVFPDIQIPAGGSISGCPIIPIDELTAYPSEGDMLCLIDASQIAADAGQLEVDVSDQTNISMLDSTTGAVNTVSMFQTNSLAIRTRRVFSLQRVRASSVAAISHVNYLGSP